MSWASNWVQIISTIELILILFCNFRWKTIPILWHRCCSPTLIEQPLQTVDWWFNYSLLQTPTYYPPCHLMVSTHEMMHQIWTTENKTTDQYYSIINIPPKFLTTIFDLISFWFFVRSWVSISYLRDFMQNTNNFQADTTLFRTSDNLFEIKTHYTLKQKLLQNENFLMIFKP